MAGLLLILFCYWCWHRTTKFDVQSVAVKQRTPTGDVWKVETTVRHLRFFAPGFRTNGPKYDQQVDAPEVQHPIPVILEPVKVFVCEPSKV